MGIRRIADFTQHETNLLHISALVFVFPHIIICYVFILYILIFSLELTFQMSSIHVCLSTLSPALRIAPGIK